MKAIFALAWRVFLVLVLAAGVELVTVPLREVSADSQTEVFNVSGTYNWTVPEGVTNITVEAWGAGGAGGGSVNITCTGSAGGGGGGGAYATSNLTVTPGDILFVVVGGGGTGVTGGNGTDGGASFVGNNTIASDAFVLAAGGKGGAANTAENQTAPGGAGGSIVDSTGQYILAGEAGGFGGEGWNITSGAGGKCAGPGGGSGGKGVDPSSDNATREGYPGYPPGGGGGGGRTSDVGEPQSGGRGGDGKVVITWESPPPPEQYCLTMAVSPYPCAGNTTPSGTTCYAANTSVNITALAAPCWQFANWTATAGTFGDPNAANTTYTMPAQNVNVTANFVPLVVYNLTINSTDCGSVTMPGEGTFPYDPCEQVHLLASPEAGCQFTGWTATAGGFTNPNAAETYFIMPCENATVTAHFKPVTPPSYPPCTPSYGLMIYSTEGGSVTSPGEGAFPYIGGYVVSLVATPDPGYRFARWTGDVGTIADVYAASTTIHMDNWYIITANFERLIPRYSLTTSSTSGGSVTNPGEGTFTYDDGAVVTLAASANSGYKFVNWTGDVATVANVNAASTTVTMRGNYSIAANFEEIHEYSLTISAGPGGSVINPGLGTFSYAAGSTVNLVAMANSGYNFQNWTGDVATVANVNSATTTITMNGDYSVRANFKEATGAGPSVPSAGGCFIATAAYGTPTAEQIYVLREFRDVVLLRSTPGSRFVSLYYRLSPPVADFIAGHEVLRTLVRETLIDPIVWIVEATGTVWGD
ncbi:MAG: InlB B-repeat-containing protein [Dehalococcoidia bacterium]